MRTAWLRVVIAASIVVPCAPAQRTSNAAEFDVRSENRRFVAQVRHVEVGKPDPARPRYELTVYAERHDGSLGKQWSAPYTKRGTSALCLLTDDGSTFLRVADAVKPDGPVVDVMVKGLPRAAFDAEALEISAPAGASEPWLAADTQSVRIRPEGELNANACLDLLGRDGLVRTIDLVTGELRVSSSRGEVSIEPPPPEDVEISTSRACIERFSAPEIVLADEPFAVNVHGNFPTPGWVLVGFGLEAPSARELVLVPCIVPPPSKTISAQVVVGFDSSASILGLPPGSYSLGVASCERDPALEPRALEVLPADLLASLEITGGDGKSERVAMVYWNARATLSEHGEPPRSFLAPADEVVPLARALRGVEAQRDARAPSGRSYTLTWTDRPVGADRATIRRTTRDDASMDSRTREVVQRILAMQPAPRLARYAVDAFKSHVTVHTSSSGLLKALGHDHKIVVQRLSGEVFAHPDDLARSRLFFEVDAQSLAVVDDESDDDRVVIEREMNGKVLETARYPRITFTSRAVEARRTSPDVYELSIQGHLSLHGVSREVELPARVEIHADALRAVGSLRLRQSDYRIRPTSAAGGTIKVDDTVSLEFDITARVE